MDHRSKRSIGKADLVAATAQFSWPPAFSSLAVSVQVLMAADSHDRVRHWLLILSSGHQSSGRAGGQACEENLCDQAPMRSLPAGLVRSPHGCTAPAGRHVNAWARGRHNKDQADWGNA